MKVEEDAVEQRRAARTAIGKRACGHIAKPGAVGRDSKRPSLEGESQKVG